MVSFFVTSETAGSISYPSSLNIQPSPHAPALATLGHINVLANHLFHPSNTANGFNLHHHIVINLLNGLHNTLEHAVHSMQASSQVHVPSHGMTAPDSNVAQAQAQNPIVYSTPVVESVVTTAGNGEYQLPNTFTHDVFGVGGWAEEGQ